MSIINLEGIDFLRFNEIQNATINPGLYAWYGRSSIPLADYKRSVDHTGKDFGENRLRNSIANHTLRYQLIPFDIAGKGAFGTKWKGCLEDDSRDFFQEMILGRLEDAAISSMDDKEFSRELNYVTKNEKNRDFLVKSLAAAAPFLTAPIYVGVAKNIRKRLDNHATLYLNLKDRITEDENNLKLLREKVRHGGTGFAQRAVAMDFNPEHFLIVTFDLKLFSKSQFDNENLRKFAVVSEWLINRWHRPCAGRR